MQSEQIVTEELKALPDNDEDYEKIESAIRKLFREEIYLPIIKLLGVDKRVIINASNDLLEGIRTGRIQFYRGSFSGRFTAGISKELRALGAKWERTTGTFKLPQSSLSFEVRSAISASQSTFQQRLDAIDRKLAQIVPEEIADRMSLTKHFDTTLWKVDRDIRKAVSKITVQAQLSEEQREKLAAEWNDNIKLEIKDWTQKEIVKLRKDVQASVFAGNRRDAAVKIIMKSHDVSINKAKFLARQETRLLLTGFKQGRFQEAGSNWYIWRTVKRPVQSQGGKYVKGMVRHDHAVLEGRKFRWDNPPITNTETGARNNPGQDFNCRCYAIPVVTFKKEKK